MVITAAFDVFQQSAPPAVERKSGVSELKGEAMPHLSTQTQEAFEDPAFIEGAAAELAALQTPAPVSPERPSSFPAGTLADVFKGAATISEKIAKYGAELAENNKKLTEATELLGGLATTLTKGAAVISALSTAFAALGAAMGFLNSLIAPDPTAVILKAIEGLSDQMRSFQSLMEVELKELKQDVNIQPKLQTLDQKRSSLVTIQMHINEYLQKKEEEDVEIARYELLHCEDPAMLAQHIHDTWVKSDGPNLLQLLYEKTYGAASPLARMIYQDIAFLMTALNARTLRSCIRHEKKNHEAPDQHQVLTFARNASEEILPLVAGLAREGSLMLQKCERDFEINYKRKLQSLFPTISVRAADEATHSLAAQTIRDALKPYSQYQWHVLVHKDVQNGQWNWPVNWHDGTFDFFEPQCKDGKACIAVVKSGPPAPDQRFLETLQEHEWPLPKSVLNSFKAQSSAPYILPSWKRMRDKSFDRMDLREWNDMVHKYAASQVAVGKLLYLGVVKPELNPAFATTAKGPAAIASWCPLHIEQLGKDDDRKTPIKLFCVATA